MSSNSVRFDRGSPVIAIVNESSDVDVDVLRRGVRALQKQLDRDFFPLWGWRAKLRFEENIPKNAMRLTIREQDPDPESEDDPGYHFIEGLPQTDVFTRDREGKLLGDLYSTLSHEVLEMVADPGVNLYAQGYYIRGKRHYAALVGLEVCDPVQDRSYEIDGFEVSDFVVPEWFEPERERDSLRFSFTGAVREPFAATPGGYFDALVGKQLRTIWGTRAPRRKRRHRLEVRKAKLRGWRENR